MATREILVVGSVALDDIETPVGARVNCLGGSANYFSASASFFAPVRLVAVVGEDFPREQLSALEARGVDLAGLEEVEGKTFHWKGRYGEDFADAETLDTQLNVFEHFDPKIPEAYKQTPVVFLGNIHPSLQSKVLDQIAKPELVGLDTMNFWITGARDDLLSVLPRVDLLIINETEAGLLSGEKNIFKAAKIIHAMGPQILVIKRGAYGAVLFHPDGMFIAPAMPLDGVVDPTGAGDTFAAGLIGHVAKEGSYDLETLKLGVLMGTVTASFAVQGFSLDRVMALDMASIEARLKELKALISLG